MRYKDLRDFIAQLEQIGELKRVRDFIPKYHPNAKEATEGGDL